jgi:6-phosphofructokinase
LFEDRAKNPSKYAVVLISEGAMFEGEEMMFQNQEKDMFGHAKLGGIGDRVAEQLKHLSPHLTMAKRVNHITQKLGYMVRGGDPDAIDSIVPMAYGNLALDLILKGVHGRLVVLKNGRYDNVPIDVVTATKKLVNIQKFYNIERLRPYYHSFEMSPLLL